MKKIVLASTNNGKIKEIRELLDQLNISLTTQSDFGLSEVDETGTTFVENAILKARYVSRLTNLPALADDSGLVVNSLLGAPGVYSARYAGKNASDNDRINKLLNELDKTNNKDRSASFHCVLVLLKFAEDPAPIISHGIWQGEVLLKPQGENGFGYDPIFYVPTHQCSAAELNLTEKNMISHRGQALKQLIKMIMAEF